MPEMECVIRGAAFADRSGLAAIGQMEPGQAVRLERNHHPRDKNAVKVFYLGVQVGWVPRELNKALAEAMDAGATATAMCTRAAVFADTGRITIEAKIRIIWEQRP